jgi:hypothetical protein
MLTILWIKGWLDSDMLLCINFISFDFVIINIYNSQFDLGMFHVPMAVSLSKLIRKIRV